MAEPGKSTRDRGKKPNPGPNCPLIGRMPAAARLTREEPARSHRVPHRESAGTRQPADILAGLPEHVMDELVDDLAEAVVAILLSQAASDASEKDDASGDLREI